MDAAVNHFEARHPYELARAGYAECVCRETGFRARDKGTGTPSQIRLPLCRDGVTSQRQGLASLTCRQLHWTGFSTFLSTTRTLSQENGRKQSDGAIVLKLVNLIVDAIVRAN